jgi:hypothetical protein
MSRFRFAGPSGTEAGHPQPYGHRAKLKHGSGFGKAGELLGIHDLNGLDFAASWSGLIRRNHRGTLISKENFNGYRNRTRHSRF